MVEAGVARSDVVFFAHLEVLAEVLVSAPPVGHHSGCSLVSALLMEVRVSHSVLFDVVWHGTVLFDLVVLIRCLSLSPSVHLAAAFLLHLGVQIEEEGSDHSPTEQEVHELHASIGVEWLDFPVNVSDWVFLEARDVLKDSPFLGFISWFSCILDEFCEVTVSLSRKSSTKITVSTVHIIYGLLTFQSYQHAQSCLACLPSIPRYQCRECARHF